MAFKTINRTIEEVERLTKTLNNELGKIKLNTLSDSEARRLDEALCYSSDFYDSLANDRGEEEGEDDEGEEDESD